MAQGHAKTKTEINLIQRRRAMASLLTSASHWCLMLVGMIDKEAAYIKSPLYHRQKASFEKFVLWETLKGKPFRPVFRATHFIKPDNFNEVPE